MSATAELDADWRVTDFHHSNYITVLLTEEGYGTMSQRLSIRESLASNRQVLAYLLIDPMLHLQEFFHRECQQM